MVEHPVREFVAYPLEDNMLEFHFSLLGPMDSPYQKGVYHGRVILPHTYPFAPPDVELITPSGRFETNVKLCVSITSYHPENWHATYGVATLLHALRTFMVTPGNNAIGAVDYSDEAKKKMADTSLQFVCPQCHQRVQDHWTQMQLAPLAADSDVGREHASQGSVLGLQSLPVKKAVKAEEAAGNAVAPAPSEPSSATPQQATTNEDAPAPKCENVQEDLKLSSPQETRETTATPASQATPLPAQAPAPPRVAPRAAPVAIRRVNGILNIELSSTVIDSLLFVVVSLIGVILAKKAVVDHALFGLL